MEQERIWLTMASGLALTAATLGFTLLYLEQYTVGFGVVASALAYMFISAARLRRLRDRRRFKD